MIAGPRVILVAHTAETAARLTANRVNTRRLPGVPFPARLEVAVAERP